MAQFNDLDYDAVSKESDCQAPLSIQNYDLTSQTLQRRSTGRGFTTNEANDRAESVEEGEEEDWQANWREWNHNPDDVDSWNRKLQDIKNSLVHKDLVIDNDEQLEQFIRGGTEAMTYLGCSVEKRPNMLHLMASSVDNNKRLVRYLVDTMPTLMFEHNEYYWWPLHVAIQAKRADFISAVLESEFHANDMTKVLARRVGEQKLNCIHMAIQEGLATELVITLIARSNQETLSQKDGAGLTPLHHAVDYRNCKKGQLEVVQALLERGDAALDVEGGADGSDRLSPFRHHEETKKVENSEIRKLEQEKQEAFGRSRKEADSADRPQAPPKVITLHKEDERSNQQRQSNTAQSVSMESQTILSTVKIPTVANSATKITNGAAPAKKKRGGQSKSMAPRKSHKPKIAIDDNTANEIAKELKLHYLRSIFKNSSDSGMRESTDGHRKEPRNQDSAVRFLYGDNKQSIDTSVNISTVL